MGDFSAWAPSAVHHLKTGFAFENALRPKHEGFDRRVVGQHRNHDFLPGSFGWVVGDTCPFLRQSLGGAAASVIHNQFVTGADEIACHRAPHIAKTKESNTHFVISFECCASVSPLKPDASD
jgi:hypothetical protein